MRSKSNKFDSLLRHRCSRFKKKTDKVWLCESVDKLKGVGHLAIEKMNELRIHTIADLQLHVCHRVKVFLYLDLALALALASRSGSGSGFWIWLWLWLS